ncbi:MAG: hypothetical protein KatS3mg088_455 [Patescibacteria group bacterium]|nr:MAG: hypothetical protein KatS3mg088_455 [Patescibacteria group bacterium]
MILKMKSNNKKNNLNWKKPIFVFFVFLVFLLVISEVFIYPGVVFNKLGIRIELFLVFYFLLVAFYKFSIPKSFNKILLFSTCLIFLGYLFLGIQEKINFKNFVFSRYHISLTPLSYLIMFLSSFLFFGNIQKISPKILVDSFERFLGKFEGFRRYFIFLGNIVSFLNWKRVWFLFIFSFVFSFFIFRENFGSSWSIIDDHEIAYFLGSDKKILVNEIPGLILKTEVGKFGEALRFRPSYYFLRIVESALWRDNPLLWYVTLFLILVIFVFTVSYLISSFFGFFVGIAFTMFIMTDVYWADILARLGPGEIYVLLGLSLYSLAFYKIFVQKSEKSIYCLLFFLGGVIAIGSKENMVILMLPTFYLIFSRLRYLKSRPFLLLMCVLQIIFSLWVFLAVYLSISKSGQNVYGQSVGIGSLYQTSILSFEKTVKELNLPFILFVVLIIFRFLGISKSIKLLINSNGVVFLFFFLIFGYMSQIVFYSGGFPTGIRYDFPGVLFKYLFWLTSFYIFILSFESFLYEYKFSFKNFIVLVSRFLLVVILLYEVATKGYSNLILVERKAREITNAFNNKVIDLSSIANNNPDYLIIFRSENPWDYEPIFSMQRFLEFQGVKNLIVLKYTDSDFENRSGLTKFLSEELFEVSKNGDKEKGFAVFNQLYFDKFRKRCILVLFSNAKEDLNCEYKISI